MAATLAALLLQPAPARAASYWVGNGGNPPCTHATLQAAIDTAVGGAGDDLIYLVGPGPFTGPFTVFGGGIYLVGNVGSCGSTTTVGFATLRAPSGSRPLTILMGGAETVTLQRIVVTTEDGTLSGDGGGIWFAGASPASRLELITSQVSACTATGNGGGIYVSGGTVVVLTSSLVALNAANNGGGIAGENGAVVEVRGGYVVSNTALLDGGGIYAPDARVFLENGSIATETVVANNIAGRDGGGLYLGGAWEDYLTAKPGVPPTMVSGNLAQRGGGLFVDGSFVRLIYASVDNNQAGAEGGGLYLTSDGAVVTNGLSELVPTLGGFPRLETNRAADGAALHVDDGVVVMSSGRIRDHHAGAGAPAVATVSVGTLLLHGVQVDANEAPALFGVESSARLQLEHLGISGNTVGGIVRWRGTYSTVSVVSTALDESEAFFASFESPSSPPAFGCVVSRFASPFAVVPPGTDLSQVTVADPQFAAPPFDLHLRPTSPGIDLCLSTSRFDLDGDRRSHDDPYHPNAPGWTGDAGIDEVTVLFRDGFESGNRGQWAGAWP